MENYEQSLKILGAEFRRIRKSQGITLSKLSELTGISRVYIGSFERGASNMSTVNLIKLSKAINTKLSGIFKKVDL